jgi:trk system potassium uptake protein TrkH
LIAFSSVLFLLGPIMLGLAVLMLIPCIVALQIGSPDLKAFLVSEGITVAAAIFLMILRGKGGRPALRIREMFLLTNLAWLMVCGFGALPFILSHTVGSFTDAVFESVSGVTTTGATVLSGLDSLPRDILLWRSIMQWIGGLGIIALGAAVLPFLRIGGMRLFKTESSDLSDKALPRTRRILTQLLLIYATLSLACTLSYWAGGMSFFDAVNHAMTTVSTGGFSTHDRSIAHFDSSVIEVIAMVFMLMAAMPFMLYLPLLFGRVKPLVSDGQVRSMLFIYSGAAVLCLAWLVATEQFGPGLALREAIFGVLSIATTTGYVSADYTNWGSFAIVLFFFLTFVGGSSGSTSGGIKIFRFRIAFVMLRETMQRLLHPRATFSRNLRDQALNDEIMASVMAYALVFAWTVGIAATLLAALGNDFVTSFSAAATATANVGPGIGDVVGPSQNFAALSEPSKWVVCAAMLLGRLEIFTVLILLTPSFWRD